MRDAVFGSTRRRDGRACGQPAGPTLKPETRNMVGSVLGYSGQFGNLGLIYYTYCPTSLLIWRVQRNARSSVRENAPSRLESLWSTCRYYPHFLFRVGDTAHTSSSALKVLPALPFQGRDGRAGRQPAGLFPKPETRNIVPRI